MSERAFGGMSPDEFLDWCQFQEGRYELVDSVPVARAGAKRRHDQIVVNVLGSLAAQLRDHRCRPFTSDTAVRIPAGNVRRPDAGVDCGEFHDDAASVESPTLVVEVLSPSTRDFDMFGKLDEYKTVPGLAHIMLVDPDTPQVMHWYRGDDGQWLHSLIAGLDAAIALPDMPISLTLTTIYAGLAFRPRPRLLRDDKMGEQRRSSVIARSFATKQSPAGDCFVAKLLAMTRPKY